MEKGKSVKEKLQGKISAKKSKWLDDAKYAEKNEAWLDKSAQIALRILRYLRENKISQLELSNRLSVSAQYVSKIVKGKENLSLETICKIEDALQINLIEIPSFESKVSVVPKQRFYCNYISRTQADYVYEEVIDYVSYSNYKENNKNQISAG
jgi:transcriptional regulator with XRE-family HTH domain